MERTVNWHDIAIGFVAGIGVNVLILFLLFLVLFGMLAVGAISGDNEHYGVHVLISRIVWFIPNLLALPALVSLYKKRKSGVVVGYGLVLIFFAALWAMGIINWIAVCRDKLGATGVCP